MCGHRCALARVPTPSSELPTPKPLRPCRQSCLLAPADFATDRDAASTDYAKDEGPTGHGKGATTD
eukprot:7601917-Alexandrium_andersonii.AAC.1